VTPRSNLLIGEQRLKITELIDPSRKEKEIFSLILVHADEALKTAEGLRNLVASLKNRDLATAEVEQSSISRHEAEADRLNLDTSLKIAQGAFFGGIREDLLALIEQIDDIADAAWDASKLIFGQFVSSEFVEEFCGWVETQKFVDTCVDTVREFINILESLPKNKLAVFKTIPVVRELEEKADEYKSEAMKKLFTKNQNPLLIIQLRDFLNVADDVADKAQDGTQTILIMLAKGY